MGLFSGAASKYKPSKTQAAQAFVNPAGGAGYYEGRNSGTLNSIHDLMPQKGGGSGGGPAQNRKAALEDGYTAPSFDPSQPISYSPSSYKAGPTYQAQVYNNPNDAVQNTALNRRFDVLRAKTEGEANTQAQQAGDALQRSAAAHGQLGSGTLVKQQMLQQKGLEAQKTNNINDVESQREVGAAQLASDQANKQFAFNQEEAGRAFQSGEAEKQRGFAASEADNQNKLAVDMANRDQSFKDQQFSAQNSQFAQQMKMAIEQQKMDQQVTDFNEKMSTKNSKDKPSAIKDMVTPGYLGRTVGGDKFNKVDVGHKAHWW